MRIVLNGDSKVFRRMNMSDWRKLHADKIIDLKHYCICPYGYEDWKAKYLVIDPKVTKPTFIHVDGSDDSIALAIPNFDCLTQEVLSRFTKVMATYFEAIENTKEERIMGNTPKYEREKVVTFVTS
jgi:hypothetical protein